MTQQSLGQKIRELRDSVDLSLRELAKKLKISAPFLSDIELGRRFPSDEVLEKMARELRVPTEELSRHDHRQPVADLKRVIEGSPQLGFAFRTVVNELKDGTLTAETLARKLLAPPPDKNA